MFISGLSRNLLEGKLASRCSQEASFYAHNIGSMPRSNERYASKSGKRWARKALVCTTLLPLFVAPLTALQTTSFVGPSRRRESSTMRLRATQVEEDILQIHVDQENASHEQKTPLHATPTHYAFEPIASVKIVGVDDLHETMPHRNGQSNGFPFHAVTYAEEFNGEKHNGHTHPHSRVVNGVRLPPYDTASGHSRPSHKEPPIVNGVAQPERNGSTQPPAVNGVISQASLNGNIQPLEDTNVSEKLDVKDNAQPLDVNGGMQRISSSSSRSTVETNHNDGIDAMKPQTQEEETTQPTVRTLWQRRHARSIEEGMRCEKTQEKTTQLYKLLSKAPLAPPKRGYFARTISGLITALAEEADGLEVNVDAQEETPLWRKKVDAIRINFTRLGFKPLRMGGLDEAIRSLEREIPDSQVDQLAENLELSAVSSADEAFARIDVDNSGSLDPDEIAKALNMAASSGSDEKLLEELASQLVELYDFNGDGVVDREEYQKLVADMAALRREEMARLEMEAENPKRKTGINGVIGKVSRWIRRKKPLDEVAVEVDEEGDMVVEDTFRDISTDTNQPSDDVAPKEEKGKSSMDMVNISDDSAVDSVARRGGSIVLEDLKLDLRQLVFGIVPIIKRVSLDLCA